MVYNKTCFIVYDVGFYYEFRTKCFKLIPVVFFRDLNISEGQNPISNVYEFIILFNESCLTRQAMYV
jgi:hypothetical protein